MKRSRPSPYAWIVLLGLLVHGQTIFFQFIYFVDDVLILSDPAFLSDPANLLRAFQQPTFSIYYRPLATASLILDTLVGGISPGVYHAANVAYHVIAACLVFLLLERLGYQRAISLGCALLFVAHPQAAQAIAWIPGRNDSLLGLFAVAGLVTFLRFIETKRTAAFAFHLLLFTLTLFTKENGVALPVLCFLSLHLVAKERLFSKVTVISIAGWLACGLTWFLLRSSALASSTAVTEELTSVHNVWRNLPTLLEVFGKFFVPLRLTTVGVYHPLSTGIGCLAVLSLGLLVTFRKSARTPLLLIGAAWFVLFLLPTLAVYIEPVDYFESRAYASLAGATLLLAELLRLGGFGWQRNGWAALFAVLGAFSMVTFLQEAKYRSDIVFWEQAVEDCPDSHQVYFSLGLAYDRNAELDRAQRTYRMAIALNPMIAGYHNNLGAVWARSGDLQKAGEEFQRVLALEPRNAYAHFNLGTLHHLRAQLDEAKQEWRKALEINPKMAPAWVRISTPTFLSQPE